MQTNLKDWIIDMIASNTPQAFFDSLAHIMKDREINCFVKERNFDDDEYKAWKQAAEMAHLVKFWVLKALEYEKSKADEIKQVAAI
jgi:hypothetical protein